MSPRRPEPAPDPGPATWPDGSVRLDPDGHVRWPGGDGRVDANGAWWPCWQCGRETSARSAYAVWGPGFLCRSCHRDRQDLVARANHQAAQPPRRRGVDPSVDPRRASRFSREWGG